MQEVVSCKDLDQLVSVTWRITQYLEQPFINAHEYLRKSSTVYFLEA